jgi:hypothetical protein
MEVGKRRTGVEKAVVGTVVALDDLSRDLGRRMTGRWDERQMEISHEIVDSGIRLTASDRFRKLITVCSFFVFVFVSFHFVFGPLLVFYIYSRWIACIGYSLSVSTGPAGGHSSLFAGDVSRFTHLRICFFGYPKRDTMRPIPSTSG